MNREIIFRGKRLDNNEWAYGYFLISQKSDKTYYIVADVLNSELMAINPKTLGQFTGLTDKNGKDIYEGDILDIGQTVNGQSKFVIMDTIGRYDVRYAHDLSLRYEYDVYDLLDCFNEEKDAEIIGNIHENPELLK